MHYVIGDIHNDLKKLKQILKQINITRDDELIVLGDVFDRGGESADPFGVYCALAGLQGKCSWIRGNHDDWLANYTYEYFNTPEKKRHKLAPYGYNSFELLRQRITEVDMRNIADLIKEGTGAGGKEISVCPCHDFPSGCPGRGPILHAGDDGY